MAIELPNGKISLTLPEQVGHNAKQISKIFQLLDGLNVQDNVVVVDDISHVLTAQEITVLQQAVAFIVYGGHLYIKSGESGSNAYFDIVFSITPPGTAITFASSRITANLSNGALAIANSSVSAYSVAQIDSLLSAKADITYVDNNFASLSGASFTGAITAPEIREEMSGYSCAIDTTDLATWNYSFNYVGVVKNGNKLTIVVNLKLKKLATTTDINPRIVRLTFPSAVNDKLFPVSIGGQNWLEQKIVNAFSSGTSYVQVPMLLSKSSAGVNLQLIGGNLVQDTEYVIRFEATFLLSDNLAS